MRKDGSVKVRVTPCHICGRPSEAPSKQSGKPVCFHHYMAELPGPAPVSMDKQGSEVYSRSLDNGIEKLAEAHRSR